eukprot:GFUD01086521.1.p1 GENE.GFUD01086521.1~~GFUD01086521.1.p1  ORF type:complete len:102 (+),score=16.90 GFUD01086521.1:52-357(+)
MSVWRKRSSHLTIQAHSSLPYHSYQGQSILVPATPASVLTALFTAGYLTLQAVAIRRNDEEREGIENICDTEVTALDTSDECITVLLITSTDCTIYRNIKT